MEIQALVTPGRKVGLVLKSPPVKPEDVTLVLGGREFMATRHQPAFLAVRLPAGPMEFRAKTSSGAAPHQVNFTPIPANSELAKRFEHFEKRSPWLGVHLGLRRDCGSTFSPVQRPVEVADTALREYVFEGAINNYPSDDVQEDNDNYLAGVREIGVRSEHTDGRDRPRLRIRSVEFEGPFYESWPPATHRRIFIGSANEDKPEVYAREIVREFAGRAYRRPVTEAEASSLMAVWKSAFSEHGDFTQSIKDTLLIVLTSPQFLFLIEESTTPKAEPLAEHELASKLSYFLWNTAPDPRLRQLADAGKLRAALDTEITRLIRDERFGQFADEFASQWLSLEKFDVVEMDRNKYPALTRDVRLNLRREPVELLQHLVRENLPARNLVQSDFILANEITASYYGLGDQTERGFDFVPFAHRRPHLGGLLAQTSILAGLSDGREANAVKRGAWLARKIIAEPPADPPPNVPGIEEIDPKLSLRERLALHRDHKGCASCHAGIDPWGLPLEQFDAGGLFRAEHQEASARLPDGTEVADYRRPARLPRRPAYGSRGVQRAQASRHLRYRPYTHLQRACFSRRKGTYFASKRISNAGHDPVRDHERHFFNQIDFKNPNEPKFSTRSTRVPEGSGGGHAGVAGAGGDGQGCGRGHAAAVLRAVHGQRHVAATCQARHR